MLREGRLKVVVASRWPSWMLSVGLICLSSGCLGTPRVAPAGATTSPTSPKLLPLVYFEDGAVLFIGADARAAQYAKDGESIFPVGIGLGNRARRTLEFDRESFVLETAAGQRYPLVSVQEFNQDYRRSANDRSLAETFVDALEVKFNPRKFQSRAFFPGRQVAARPARGTPAVESAVDSFVLGTTEWTHMYLYFPMPADGLHRRGFKLLVSVAGEPDPFVVAFEVR